MEESDELHAMCESSEPPTVYLNESSLRIKAVVTTELHGIAAYTFDAGPNPFIITLAEYEAQVLKKLLHLCKLTDGYGKLSTRI